MVDGGEPELNIKLKLDLFLSPFCFLQFLYWFCDWAGAVWMLEWKRLIYIWSLETGESLIGGVVITVLIVPALAVLQT